MYATASTRRLANQWRSKSGGGASLQASLRQYQSDQDHAKKRLDEEFTRRRMARNRKVTLNTKDPCYRVAVCLLLPTFICIVVGAVMTLCSHSRPIGVGTHFWESPRRSMYRWVGPVVFVSGSITMFFNYMMYKRAQLGPGSMREQWERKKERQGGSILPRRWNRRPRPAVISVTVDGPEASCKEGLLQEEAMESVELQDLSYGQDNMTFKHSPMYRRKPVNMLATTTNWIINKRPPLLSKIPFSRRQEIDIEPDTIDQDVDWRWSGIRPQTIKRDPSKILRDRERRDFLLKSLTEEPTRRRPDIVEPRPIFPAPDPTTFKRVVLGKTPPDKEDEWECLKVSRDSLLVGARDRSDSGAYSSMERVRSTSRLSPEIILKKARERHGSSASFVSLQGSDTKGRSPSRHSNLSALPSPCLTPSPVHLAPPDPYPFITKSDLHKTSRRATASDIYQGQELGIHSVSWRRASEPFTVIMRDAGTQTPRRGRILRSRGKLKVGMDEAVQCNSPVSETSSAGVGDSVSLDSTQDTAELVCITTSKKYDSRSVGKSCSANVTSSDGENPRPHKVNSVPLIPTRLYEESRAHARIDANARRKQTDKRITKAVGNNGSTSNVRGNPSDQARKSLTQSRLNIPNIKSNQIACNQNTQPKMASVSSKGATSEGIVPIKLPSSTADPVSCILISTEDFTNPRHRLLSGSDQGESLASLGVATGTNQPSIRCYQLLHMPGPPQARSFSSASSSPNDLLSPMPSPNSSCGSVFENSSHTIPASPTTNPTNTRCQLIDISPPDVAPITEARSAASDIPITTFPVSSNLYMTIGTQECSSELKGNEKVNKELEPQESTAHASVSTYSQEPSLTWNCLPNTTATSSPAVRPTIMSRSTESPMVVLEDQRTAGNFSKRPAMTKTHQLPSARSASILLESIDKVCRGAEFYMSQTTPRPSIRRQSGYSSDV